MKEELILSLALVSMTLFDQFFDSKALSNMMNYQFYKIDSVKELALLLREPININVIVDKEISTWTYLKNSRDPYFREVSGKMKISKSFWSINEDIEDLNQGKCIWVGYDHIFEYLTRSYPGLNMHISSERYYSAPLVILYSVDIKKAIEDKIDPLIYTIRESGLYNLWELRKYNIKPQTLFTNTVQNKAITLENIKGVFYLLFTIYLVIMVIFILEISGTFEDLKN